ncbi:MAG: hypothetical protein R2762_14135 [Bryobacteraceae bacterium]
MGIGALLFAFALGMIWVAYVLGPRHWADWVLTAGLGVATGIGVTSFNYFVLTWIGLGRAPWIAAVDLMLLAPVAWLWWKGREGRPVPEERAGPNLILAAVSAGALAVAMGAVASSADQLPYGEWDAWSQWNLRARYLAGDGDQWRNAVSRDLVRSHPDYPLLLPSAVARAWRFQGEHDPDVPKLLGIVFLAAVFCVLFGTLARVRNANAGLLGLCVLTASAGYLSQGPAQYADIPLSLFVLGAIACALLDQYELGGLLASAAAFTKNEGLVFALAYLVLVRKLPALTGAAPGLVTVAAFKLFLAPPSEFAGGAIHGENLLPSLWAMGQQLYGYGLGIGHPVLLLAVLGFGLGIARTAQPMWSRCMGILAIQFLGYLAAYVVTPNDLTFMLASTARVIGQIWPALILLLIARLNSPVFASPESAAREHTKDHPAEESHAGRGKARKR